MYMVISRWDAGPDRHDEFVEKALALRKAVCSMPGVIDGQGLVSEEGIAILLLTFTDQASYENLYSGTDNPFARAIEEQRLDLSARWLGTERGELIPEAD